MKDLAKDTESKPTNSAATAELSMNVRVYRGDAEIGQGELLPNGSNMAFCPTSSKFELLEFEADTEKVEAKVPMEFYLNNKMVAKGELYDSGENYCLCPDNQELNLIDPKATAKLSIDPKGKSARLDVNGSNN